VKRRKGRFSAVLQGQHFVDIAGVASSILATPTIELARLRVEKAGFFML
jgi:hypothetical protein